jgi:hypothetical protein
MRPRSVVAGMLGGACLGLLAGWLLWKSDGVAAPAWTAGPWREETVLVIAVGTREDVDLVRRAVAPERIVASTQAGFAVEPRRLVVTDLESAGVLLARAGWSDHSLEIIDADRMRGDAPADERVSRIASLLDAQTLSRGVGTLLGQTPDLEQVTGSGQ